MRSLRPTLALLLLPWGVLHGAALVPLPEPDFPLQTAGLEANRGQAKSEFLFLSREQSLGVTRQSILFHPYGVRQVFLASNPDPEVDFLDPLPGVVNSLTGSDARKWITGIPRYGSVYMSEVYPGVDAQYLTDSEGRLVLRLLFGSGVSPDVVVFEVAEAVSMALTLEDSLVVKLGRAAPDPALVYPAPAAFQGSAAGRVDREARFEIRSGTRFGFQVDGRDGTLPLQIEIRVSAPDLFFRETRHSVFTSSSAYVATTTPAVAGSEVPFPLLRWAGCAETLDGPLLCTDVAVYKFSDNGELLFATYLAGQTREEVSFVALAADGTLMLTGTTDSADFPVTVTALQKEYGGPPATNLHSFSSPAAGDYFAAKLDPDTGMPIGSTYLGGPRAETVEETAMGPDGSLYFLPEWLGMHMAEMPVTPGAVQRECLGDPCTNGYAAHLSPLLDELLYGTYLPGTSVATAKLHSDGSVYFGGWAREGFPVTPTAYQSELASGEDAVLGRLDPSGRSLVFGTYIGGEASDYISRIAVAPDGSVWAYVISIVECCPDTEHRLVRLDAMGEQVLTDMVMIIHDIAVDPEGNLNAMTPERFPASPDAFQAHACGRYGGVAYTYIKLNPGGQLLFATYLPANTRTEFEGTSERGLPVLRAGEERFEIVEEEPSGVFTGCVVDGASFAAWDSLSPGAIITLFGSRMGPLEGVGFQLEGGRVPTSLAGTRVLVNGEAVPVLFASYWQVNAILPYSVSSRSRPSIQVESDSVAGNEYRQSFVVPAANSIFVLDDSPLRPAAALNEDGTLNSRENPAAKGSRVMLFGTGGGPTIPPGEEGEVTPLELRTLEHGVDVEIPGGPPVVVEFAGAAPGLLSGVTQINIRLPDELPEIEGFPTGVVPLNVATPGISHYPGFVTIAVHPD